jgi:hypothetical protein
MNDVPETHSSANSSPGQAERREHLLRAYDDLDDAEKQKILQLAIALFERRAA